MIDHELQLLGDPVRHVMCHPYAGTFLKFNPHIRRPSVPAPSTVVAQSVVVWSLNTAGHFVLVKAHRALFNSLGHNVTLLVKFGPSQYSPMSQVDKIVNLRVFNFLRKLNTPS